MDILKPYLLLATVAFVIGFMGYWAVGRVTATFTHPAEAGLLQAPVSADAPEMPLDTLRHT